MHARFLIGEKCRVERALERTVPPPSMRLVRNLPAKRGGRGRIEAAKVDVRFLIDEKCVAATWPSADSALEALALLPAPDDDRLRAR